MELAQVVRPDSGGGRVTGRAVGVGHDDPGQTDRHIDRWLSGFAIHYSPAHRETLNARTQSNIDPACFGAFLNLNHSSFRRIRGIGIEGYRECLMASAGAAIEITIAFADGDFVTPWPYSEH